MAAERVLRHRFSYEEEWEMRELDKEFALEPVPQKYRNGFWQMLAVMMGLTFFSASMLSGGELAMGLNLVQFVLIVLIGNLMLGLRSEEHTSELQSRFDIVCRLLLPPSI